MEGRIWDIFLYQGHLKRLEKSKYANTVTFQKYNYLKRAYW